MRTLVRHETSSVFSGSLYVIIFAIGIPLFYFLTSISLDKYLGNVFRDRSEVLILLGSLIAFIGLFIITSATMRLYYSGKGLPLSSSPPEKLVTDGPYGWSRHPIYLGAVLLFAGTSLIIKSFWGLVLGTPFLGFFYFLYARGIEEPELISHYQDAYYEYRNEVPFVISYPLRRGFHKIAGKILDTISDIINRPKMFHIGHHIFFWGYGIWPGLGVAFGLAVMEYILLVQGVPRNITAGLIITLTILGLFGVRLTWRIITSIRKQLHFKKTAGVVGFMSWGTLLALILTIILFHYTTPYSGAYLLDAALPGILLAHFWGRIGCMFYGCCYGKSTQGSCGLQYYHRDLKVIRIEHVHEKRVLPVQIFSSLYGLTGFILILGYWSRFTLSIGTSAAFTAIWYGSFRLDEEWLREQSVIWLKFLSPAQIISSLIMLTGLLWFLSHSPETLKFYKPILINQDVAQIIDRMHVGLILVSGIVTTFLFSYHYREIGKWK